MRSWLCVEMAVAALYLMWACTWAKTWSLTLLRCVYLYTPLCTIVRVANAASSMSPTQMADAIMTAGAMFLPDIVIVLALTTAIIMACATAILYEFYSPDRSENGNDQYRKRRRASSNQRWTTQRAADMASWCGTMMEAMIGSMRTHRQRGDRKCNAAGNTARWTAMQRATRLTKRGAAVKRHKSIITEIEAAFTNSKTPHIIAMTAAYKSPHDGHRYDSDSKLMAIDNCCSKCITNDIDDYIEPPHEVCTRVQGIGGTITAKLCGTVRWEIEDDEGVVHQQTIPGTYYNPDSEYKLYSPQHVAQVYNDHYPKQHGTWCATYDDSVVLQWDQRKFTRTVLLDKKKNVALMRSATGYQKFTAFCNVLGEDEPLVALTHTNQTDCSQTEPGYSDDQFCQDTESPDSALRRHPDLPDEVFIRSTEQQVDHDIDPPTFDLPDASTAYDETKAQMLEWHCRLGHLPFNKIQELAKRGDLPSKFAKCAIPVCGACLYAKTTRRPWRGRPTVPYPHEWQRRPATSWPSTRWYRRRQDSWHK
jgi:GAG-pre-integrase domain